MTFRPTVLEKRYSLTQAIVIAVICWFIGIFINVKGIPFANESNSIDLLSGGVIGFAFAAIAFAVLSIRYVQQTLFLKQRGATLQAIAERQGWSYAEQSSGMPSGIADISLLSIADRDRTTLHRIDGEDWSYVDLSYNIYQKTKNGEFVRSTAYYALMVISLPRELPNVLFDSKRSRGKQFKFEFNGDQRHQLEGDFSKYFDTYMPANYETDSLSFITPEVMESLISAADYDIEIHGSSLVLFGTLYNPEEQLLEMHGKLTAIRKKLLNNILTYRDERMPYNQGRSHVAPSGIAIKRRLFNPVTVAITILWLALYIGIQFIPQGQ